MFEVDKMKRLYDLVSSLENSATITSQQKDFVRFVDEHDIRRGTKFLETFPEMAEFYNNIKEQL